MDDPRETLTTEDDKRILFSRSPWALMRRYLSGKGEAALRWYAETVAGELSLARATSVAAASADMRILKVTWKAAVRPRHMPWLDAIFFLLGFLTLTVRYTVVEFQTFHTIPAGDVRRARLRWLLARLVYPLLFFWLIASLVVSVLFGALVGAAWMQGGAAAKGMGGFVVLLCAGLIVFCGSYFGIVCLSFLKIPKAIRPILRFPFRAASIAPVPRDVDRQDRA